MWVPALHLLCFPCSYLIEKGVCYLVLCEGSFPKKLAFAYLEDLQAEFYEQHGKKVPTVSRPYSFIEFGETLRPTKQDSGFMISHEKKISSLSSETSLFTLLYLYMNKSVFIHKCFGKMANLLNTHYEKRLLKSLLFLSGEPWFDAAPSPDTYIQKTKKSYIDSRARRNLGSINTELQDVQRIMVANIEEVLQRGEALSGASKCSHLSTWASSHPASVSLTSASTDFSLPCSSRLQGQQPVQPVKEVQERCQIPEHPLYLRQAGSRRCLFHHVNCLCTLLVALRAQSGGEGSTEMENWLNPV